MDTTGMREWAYTVLRDESTHGQVARGLRYQAAQLLDVPAYMRLRNKAEALRLARRAKMHGEIAEEKAMREGCWIAEAAWA